MMRLTAIGGNAPRALHVLALLFAFPLAFARGLDAQSPDSSGCAHGDRRFIRPRELTTVGGGIAASLLLSAYDVRIARWDQSSGVQGSPARRRLVNDITHVNESTLTVGGLVLYGVGRLSHVGALADVAKHMTAAVVVTSLASQVIRGPLGRTRPYVTQDSDQYRFQSFEGFRHFDNRAWPSLHSATAFAAGAALVSELRDRHPSALPWAVPLIYAAASLPGLSRMYLDQHWASDVLAGDVLGAVIGGRLVRYAHSSPPGAGPRWLVNASVAPADNGALMIVLSVRPR